MIFLKELALSFDRAVFFFFQELQRPWLDLFLAWPTRLGETRICLFFLVLGILILDKKRCPHSIPSGILAILAVSWTSPALKSFFQRPRPHIFWDHVHVIFKKPFDDAFPSGHTASIFSAAFIVAHYYPRKAVWAYWVAGWVAVTRIYVGVHYPTDLVGGAMFGIACAWLACRFVGFLARRTTDDLISTPQKI